MTTNKVKSILLSKNRIHNSPSPDSKRSNIVKPTSSPTQQIQKFLFINKQSKKLKKQISTSKLVPTNQKIQSSKQNFLQKQQKYKNRIFQLENQVKQYQIYMGEYQQLAHKNKKLQQQMGIILHQLQNRSIRIQEEQYHQHENSFPSPNLSPKARVPTFPTLQSSIQQNSSPSPAYHKYSNINKHKNKRNLYQQINQPTNQQIQCLYQYIENLQDAINGVVSQSKQFEQQLKKNVKKDMNDMQQRLMNYIFGLEERVSQATFRNHDIMKKIQTFRENYGQGESDRIMMSKRSSKKSMKKSNSGGQMNFRKNTDEFGESNSVFILTENGGKSSSQNLENFKKDKISNPSDQQHKNLSRNQQKTVKKQKSKQQFPITVNKCQKCVEYLQIINQLTQKIKYLQQQLIRYRQSQSQKSNLKQSPIQNLDSNKTSRHSQKKIQSKQQKLQQQIIRQSPQNQQMNISQKIYQRINTLQSNINIIMQSSVTSSISYGERKQNTQNKQLQQNDKNDDKQLIIYQKSFQKSYMVDKSNKSNIQKQQIEAQNYYKLQKIKQQLINIMQNIQQIIHQCQAHPKNNIVNTLNRKLKQQQQYISQLQQQVSRLRMQVEQGRSNREKLQKLMKMQVREQQDGAGSPYFRPISQPISCIDHKVTKGKINQILNSIRKFQDQLHQSQQQNKGGFTNTF